MTEQEIAQILVGVSDPIRRIRSQISKVARTTLPILVQGPTGAGKEVVVQALHRASGRAGKLVAFNVCALPDTMFESELFGHVRGAFTGAHADSAGLLTEARGGTAFFDEISGLTLMSQVKLLRAIERQEYRPLGAKADHRSDFRVVAASNADLYALAEQRLFRADLVQRLAGLLITVPALAERPADIRPLVERFLVEAITAAGRHVEFNEDAMRLLEDQPWPGNVRELRMTIDRAVLLADSTSVGRRELLHLLTAREAQPRAGVPLDASARREMLALLDAAEWNTAALAARLGTHRATIYRWMRRLGIESRLLRFPPASDN